MNGPVARFRAFTLIELLVTVAIIALLIGVLLPSLAAARRSGREVVCLSNLRQAYVVLRTYADENEGRGPAIGEPYLKLPNWALVVQQEVRDVPVGQSYSKDSILVCPSATAYYGREMLRTYAMNTTGHAGVTGDRDSYDDPARSAHIRMDLVARAAETPLLVDSAVAVTTTAGPPPTRTASMIDFRQSVYVTERLGRFHSGSVPANDSAFNVLRFDGSAASAKSVDEFWRDPLP